MQKSLFTSRSPGTLVKNLDGLLTFVPQPLYPTDRIEPPQSLLEEVLVALARLDGIARTLPDPTILVKSFVRREAQLSSYIENTFAKYDDVAEAARLRKRSSVHSEIAETLNAERAILAGVDAVVHRHQPVSNSLIRQLHQVLMTDVRGHDCRGKYREKQVYIGNKAMGIAGARFVPPASHLVSDLMEQFQKAWESKEHFSLVRIAMLHYQFETIHPFDDGNGRLGRILTLLGLCSFGPLTVPLLNASLHFERNRQQYYDGLLRVSTHGDWQAWVTFFWKGCVWPLSNQCRN